MKTALILHGMPSQEEYSSVEGKMSEQQWFPWLMRELTEHGIEVHAPDFPEPYAPDYEKWKGVFEQYPAEGATLVGHSCGAGFLLRWLSEHADVRVGKLALVAPWIDIDGRTAPRMFTGFQVDADLPKRTQGMAMFCSDDDDREMLDTFKLLRGQLPDMKVKAFTGRGHFEHNDFPELRDFLLA